MDNLMDANLQQAAGALAETLLKTEPFVRYQQANQRLDSDEQASRLLDALAQAQADLRQSQRAGETPEAMIERIDALQEQVRANEIIMDLAQAQQDVVQYLQQINADISQQIGIDFSALARRSSCC